jgi:hypothetical protein
LRTGLDRYPNSFSALHLGLARPARLSDTLVKSRPRSAARLAAKGTPNKINSAARMCPNRAGTDQLDPNSGTTARLTNGIWNFALSPAYTKSQCVSMVVPPQWRRPARPLSAACRNRSAHSSAWPAESLPALEDSLAPGGCALGGRPRLAHSLTGPVHDADLLGLENELARSRSWHRGANRSLTGVGDNHQDNSNPPADAITHHRAVVNRVRLSRCTNWR